jgi:two-component system sensor histidine kinase/response regulator
MNDWNMLVVEDEPDGQIVVARLLRHFNVEADTVSTGEDALEALSQKSYTAVIVDLNLPGMDGLELVQAIRDNGNTSRLPCIAITAYHTSAVKQQAITAGFDAYFSKPIDDTAFVREITRIVNEN